MLNRKNCCFVYIYDKNPEPKANPTRHRSAIYTTVTTAAVIINADLNSPMLLQNLAAVRSYLFNGTIATHRCVAHETDATLEVIFQEGCCDLSLSKLHAHAGLRLTPLVGIAPNTINVKVHY
ncbi:hypothetical protein EVAR_2599_1 [Eumeta japonica]|uniref:Uncharacterized protein n=1 Tax=Eumeta variegata TaxID=151549 RepID=A0A4C1SPI1_EUMVA|nr:hypothetical protein EVAR_2599_1 [Eumeta japonica]